MGRLRYFMMVQTVICLIAAKAVLASSYDQAIEFFNQGNFEDGVPLLEKALAQGDYRPHLVFGKMYMNGVYFEKSVRKALVELHKGADKGDVVVHNYLGYIYSEEKFGVYDLNKSIKHFTISVEKDNNPSSMYSLAILYFENYSPRKDKAALALLTKAANQGHAKSMFELGARYMRGAGVSVDGEKAYYWSQKAANAGIDSGKFNANQLEKFLLDEKTVQRVQARIRNES